MAMKTKPRKDPNVLVENARIVFRNFEGKEGRFNVKGDRNFALLLDRELADIMLEDGWNVKELQPRNPEDDIQPFIKVSVSYKNIPPRIFLITSHGKRELTEDTINILDWAEIENVDLVIRPYNWEISGKTGTKAYVKQLYVTIVEDKLENKYWEVPDSAHNAIGLEPDEEAF